MINNFKEYNIIERIKTGASAVEKYKLTKHNRLFMLRLFDARFMKNRYVALENMKLLLKNNVNVPQVYDEGILDEKQGFAIVEWIEGVPLEQMLSTAEEEWYYGKVCAYELKKMHSVRVDFKGSVYEDFKNSFNKKLLKIKEISGLDENIELFEKFVKANIYLLKKQEVFSIIHGDFHPGNLILDKNDNITFIDLDVSKIAHPWFDLSSNACNMNFPIFYSSVIYNYFDGNIPEDFWNVYSLFGSWYVLDYILYLTRTKGTNVYEIKSKLTEFLEYTDYFNEKKPKWFQIKKDKEKVLI